MIVAVFRTGGIYEPAHVRRLAAQVRQWAPRELFVCLSDVEVEGVPTLPLRHDWPGWWAKLELFRPHAFPEGARVLYLDLDTSIVGPIDDLLVRPEPFLAIGDFYRRPPRQPERGLGSGLLRWTAGEHTSVYARFAREADAVMARCARGGDQVFLEECGLPVTFWEDVVPGQVVSYKVHCRPHPPEGARVVCFHGQPKPWQVPELRAREACHV